MFRNLNIVVQSGAFNIFKLGDIAGRKLLIRIAFGAV